MIGNVVNKERYSVLSTTPLASYEIPFKYWATSQIIVVITSSAGVETTVDTANYSVSTPGDTGTIEFAVGYSFPTGTSVLTIYRSVTIEQQTDYRNGDVLDADVLEKSFDVTISMLQQLNERLDRTVRIPVSDPNLTLEMPSALIRANMLLGFDASGNIIPILTSDIEQKLTQALAAEDSVLAMYNNAGMVAVRTDMATPATSKIQAVAADLTNIDTVATAIANVNAVGTNIANVNAVASNATNINAVNANKTNIDAVAGNAANINIAAGAKANIDIVAGISSQVVAVAADATDIGTVAADLALGASSNIKIVAADKANIDAVALNKTNIDAVAANATNINAAVANATNINTVADDLALGASSNVKKVADAISNVNAVGAAITNVNNVAAKLTEVDNVSDNMTAVVSAHTNIAAIIAAPDEASAAAAARDKAQKWAEEVEDTPVETGKYSAKHHAAKAAVSAASAALADAAANKQITIDGTLFQYALVYENGHLIRRFSEVI